MAQRISRAKRTVEGVRFDQPGDVATVLRVLYLVFNEGYSGDVDLAGEAIRLTRQLAARIDHEEVAGLLALMLLHHARRPARTGPDGRLVPLAEQDRNLWDTGLIAEGVEVLQTALGHDRLGEYQAQAAIAALHADARTAEETDWVQIVGWYDELVRLTDSPVARLNRAVAVGEADGARAGLAALAELDPALPRFTAVAAYLHEHNGEQATAARLYAEAARSRAEPPGARPSHAPGGASERAAERRRRELSASPPPRSCRFALGSDPQKRLFWGQTPERFAYGRRADRAIGHVRHASDCKSMSDFGQTILPLAAADDDRLYGSPRVPAAARTRRDPVRVVARDARARLEADRVGDRHRVRPRGRPRAVPPARAEGRGPGRPSRSRVHARADREDPEVVHAGTRATPSATSPSRPTGWRSCPSTRRPSCARASSATRPRSTRSGASTG